MLESLINGLNASKPVNENLMAVASDSKASETELNLTLPAHDKFAMGQKFFILKTTFK